jgi:hypothetical protein
LAQNWHKRTVLWPIIGDFPGLLFTDKYTGSIDHAVYFVILTLMNTPQNADFQDRGGGVFSDFFGFLLPLIAFP